MEVKIIQEKLNPLFSRKEVVLEVKNEIVPSKAESVDLVSKEFKCNTMLVRIRDVKGRYGESVFKVTADIYDSVEEFNRIVKKTKQEIEKEKKEIEEAKKAEEEKKKAEEEARKSEEEKKEESEVKEEKKEEPSNEKKEEAKV